jgi:peroxiredoxin
MKKATREKSIGSRLAASVALIAAAFSLQLGCSKGPKAPDFTVPALEGGDCSLSAEKGKVVVLTLWSYRCGYCRKQLEELKKLAKKIDSDKVSILAVHLRGGVDISERIRRLKPHEDVRICLGDRELAGKYKKGKSKLEEKYTIRGVPHNLVLDQKGHIRQVRRGLTKAGVLKEDVGDLL